MTTKPWDDVDPGWPDDIIADMAADNQERSEEDIRDGLKRTKWLEEEASIQEVFEHAMPDCVTLDDDTVKESGYYVWTPYAMKPGEVGFGSENDELGPLDWNLSIRHSIDRYTEYEISNTRMKHGQFVVTLKPSRQKKHFSPIKPYM